MFAYTSHFFYFRISYKSFYICKIIIIMCTKIKDLKPGQKVWCWSSFGHKWTECTVLKNRDNNEYIMVIDFDSRDLLQRIDAVDDTVWSKQQCKDLFNLSYIYLSESKELIKDRFLHDQAVLMCGIKNKVISREDI